MAQLIENDSAVVISDLHVGDPDIDPEFKKKGLDDFDRDDDFARLLNEVIPRRAGWPATLIINGDFIDFVQVLPELGRHSAGDRYGVTQNHSKLKLERVIKGHPKVFEALGTFLAKGGQVLVLPGNHDIDLHWDGLFEDFRKAVGGAGEPKLRFIKSGAIDEQRIYIEHGNQYSYDNWFEYWLDPIRDAPDERKRLERPWGTLFLDIVYNDVKDLYPFSNKVYPHAELAWIALRSFRDDKHVSAKAIARLIMFFAGKGKRFLWNHLLGDDSKEFDSLSIEEVWRKASGEVDEGRLSEVKAEIAALGGIDDNAGDRDPTAEDGGETILPGLLGRNDDRGMSKKQNDLLLSGEVDLVAFGHTHKAIDGNVNPQFGLEDHRRTFNTGSWVPNIPIGAREKLYWKDLRKKTSQTDIKYLVIDLKPYPVGRLEVLMPEDRG